jgi:nucleoside-diphosphate kinase
MKSLNQFIYEVENSEVNGFCVLKPEFLSHTEDFLKLLSNQGWTVVQKIKKKISPETAKELYSMHKDKPFYKDLCDYMSSGEALYCLCQKNCEDPCKDMKKIKDKIRTAWGKDDMRNAMHSSDTLDNVNRESKLIFENKLVECCCDPCCGETCCGTPLPSKSQADLQILGLTNMTPEIYDEYTGLLNQALCEEMQAWCQYYTVIPFLAGNEETKELQKLFAEIAHDELEDHAQWIMKRMSEIDFIPTAVFNSCWYNLIPCKHRSDIYTGCTVENIINNITLETGAIDTYVHLVDFTKKYDPESYEKMKDILKDEEEHLDKLRKLLNKYIVK